EVLMVAYNPINATEDKTVVWSTSNSDVAVVENGTVTAKANGTAVITAKVGNKEAVYTVTVGILGHVSGGDLLSVTDARMILQFLVKKIDFTPAQLDLANVSGNTAVSVTDARLILQRLVQKIDKFPRETI
ncbi:MAG: Ig-like domain-containing protein, partial [Oscillospiraceae bacterium]|nr:Ig-like domain-containing protein [Oscillospiraceae bacterium]